jgi:hypothetical protein
MRLTKENKKHIDSLSYEQLLSQWRFAPMGSPWFRGETGDYWGSAMNTKKKEIGEDKASSISKDIGWN